MTPQRIRIMVITLCSMISGIVYTGGNSNLWENGPTELVFYKNGKTNNTVIQVGDKNNQEFKIRKSNKLTNIFVVGGERFTFDQSKQLYVPLCNYSTYLQINESNLADTYPLIEEYFINVNGRYYKASQEKTHNQTSSNTYMIAGVLYERKGNLLEKMKVDGGISIDYQAFEEPKPIYYESEDSDCESEAEPSQKISSFTPTSTSSTSSSSTANPTTFYVTREKFDEFIEKFNLNIHSMTENFRTLFASRDAFSENFRILKQQIEKNQTGINSNKNRIDTSDIKRSFLRLKIQSQSERVCDFVAATATWAWPLLRFAPLMIPITLPVYATYGAALLSIVSLATYWKRSVTKRVAKINKHNNRITELSEKLMSRYKISNPFLTALGNRLVDFTYASLPIALFMLAQKNKTSIPIA